MGFTTEELGSASEREEVKSLSRRKRFHMSVFRVSTKGDVGGGKI